MRRWRFGQYSMGWRGVAWLGRMEGDDLLDCRGVPGQFSMELAKLLYLACGMSEAKTLSRQCPGQLSTLLLACFSWSFGSVTRKTSNRCPGSLPAASRSVFYTF